MATDTDPKIFFALLRNLRTIGAVGWKQKPLNVFLLFSLLFLWMLTAEAGVFEFVSDPHEVDIITHPTGYIGRGGELVVTVGISPSSPHADEMEIPVHNAINTWNRRVPTTGNIRIDESIVPRHMFDFESVALHELGHCIGLAHPNLATESGLNGDDKNYTSALRGNNGRFDLNSGADGVIGSLDDQRGDDVNLHWFNTENNNPFVLAEVVDKTTYSLNLDDLPAGHQFAANGDRTVSMLYGLQETEAVMQQGIESGEARRTLVADDIATLRLAMSGLDRLEGTPDDYTLTLRYQGITDDVDIIFSFDDSASFAACRINGIFLNDKHVAILDGHISFNSGFAWFFNQAVTSEMPIVSILANNQSGESIVVQPDDHLSLTVELAPGSKLGDQADYWVRAITPVGHYWLNNAFRFIRSDEPVRAYGGPLIELFSFSILENAADGLPAGVYTITFAVDDNQDLVYDETYQSTVSFTVLPR